MNTTLKGFLAVEFEDTGITTEVFESTSGRPFAPYWVSVVFRFDKDGRDVDHIEAHGITPTRDGLKLARRRWWPGEVPEFVAPFVADACVYLDKSMKEVQ